MSIWDATLSEMNFESPETIEQRRIRWDETLRSLETVVDRLGRHIDQEIKPTVAALQCSGFETEASCGGHVDSAFKVPWVDISFFSDKIKADIRQLRRDAKLSGNTEVERSVIEEARMKLLAGTTRLMAFLDEFYRDRQASFEARLIIRCFPDSVRLQNQGAEIQSFYSPDLQPNKLNDFRSEFEAFTDFLKERFLSGA